MNCIDHKILDPQGLAEMRKQFRNAEPYPHIVIENFLDEETAQSLYENFPKMSSLRKHYKGLNEQKSEGSSFETYHGSFLNVVEDLRSKEFIHFLEEMTGIDNLSIPADHRGSGVHQGENGSFLDVHVDFSVHPVLNLHRRLNVLIFLNKDWTYDYGGRVEMWDPEVKTLVKEYIPGFNRCVIFECSETSFHGYDKITVPEGETRKSIYSYFYSPVAEGVRYHDTIFKARPSESNMKRVKTNLKESLKNGVKRTMRKLGMKSIFNKIE